RPWPARGQGGAPPGRDEAQARAAGADRTARAGPAPAGREAEPRPRPAPATGARRATSPRPRGPRSTERGGPGCGRARSPARPREADAVPEVRHRARGAGNRGQGRDLEAPTGQVAVEPFVAPRESARAPLPSQVGGAAQDLELPGLRQRPVLD